MKKFLFFIFLVLLLVGITPMILSTPWGNRLLISLADSNLQVEKITLRWLGPQEVKEVRYLTSEGKFSADEIIYGDTLIALLRKEIPKSLKVANGKFAKSDFQMNFDGERVLLRVKGEILSLKLNGSLATGDFTISDIDYKDLPIKTVTGTWTKKQLVSKGKYGETPFTIATKLRVNTKGIQVKKPLLLEASHLQATMAPFTYSFDEGLNTPLLLDFDYWGIEGKLTTELKEKTGPITLAFSKGVEGKVSGQLQDGVLQLNDDLKLKLLLTEDLTDLLYQNFDIKLAKSNQPFTLFISKQGFSLPLLPYNPKGFAVKKGQLDLGKFTLNDTGLASTIIIFLEINNSGDLSFWFAPMDFSIRKGKVTIERTDFLMENSFHLATWGTIRIPKRRVSMVIGITAEVLAKRFSLDNLSDTYVLQIPYKGDFGKVKLDTKKASERITWLLARKKVAPEVGGTWGQIFSTLSDAGEPSSPPPKKPFPWKSSK